MVKLANTKKKLRNLLLGKQQAQFRKTVYHDVEGHTNQMLLDYYGHFIQEHPDVFIVLSPAGRFVAFNRQKIMAFFDLPSNSKLDFLSVLGKDNHSRLKRAFFVAVNGKTVHEAITLPTSKNSTKTASVSFIPIKTRHGLLKGVMVSASDHNKVFCSTIQRIKEVNEHQLQHAQEIANVGSWEYDIDTSQLHFSHMFKTILGIPELDVANVPALKAYIHPDDLPMIMDDIDRALTTGKTYTHEFRIIHGRQDNIRYIKSQAEVLLHNNKPEKVIGVIKDITDTKIKEDIQARTSVIFDHLEVGIWRRRADRNHFEYLSKGIEHILGIPLEAVEQEPYLWEKIIHADDYASYKEQLSHLDKGHIISQTYRIICPDDTIKWVLDQTIPTMTNSGHIGDIYGILTDVTTETEAKQKLTYYATHDILTELPNEQSLDGYLKECINDTAISSFALLYMNLDHFSRIYYDLGHDLGNRILKVIATTIRNIIPENGYLARMNNNGFVAVLPLYSQKEDVYQIAKTIIHQLEDHISVNDYDVFITTEIGISFYPDHGDDRLTLLRSAHSAAYQGKKQGENNDQIYSYSSDIPSHRKYLLEKDMKTAIANQEFELYYQPVINPETHTITYAEVLLRWQHPEWGFVYPNEFIPLAEETHYIDKIGDWVIEKVCAHLREWKHAGLTLRPVSINISPIHILKTGLAETIIQQLNRYDIASKYLILEITESTPLKSDKHVLSTLSQLKDLGIKIAIDDFGTGYASINYLRDFQADILKIDQVFIQNIDEDNQKNRAIVSSMLHLAKGLEMSVVAEGVEEMEQLMFLTQNKCDMVQGYIYSKPVPIDTYTRMLQTAYLRPKKHALKIKPEHERRAYFRFEFSECILASVSLKEFNKEKVNLGSTDILIENLSAGGIKFISDLRLPIHTAIKYMFHFTVLNEAFNLEGTLVWTLHAKGDTYFYGCQFDITETERDRIVNLVNKMTAMTNLNEALYGTPFINENPYTYLNKRNMNKL
ncbi:EAL domain-containing protein [Lentibacillus saliphilus]|uniref:EAL domain-containing protein n=1 Tax=Lentibacillus saliphilus TaxID=2737028 RepID=UPI001C2FFA1B|nr:EAL domain-containing protein [Lentibacillus saliphilus]